MTENYSIKATLDAGGVRSGINDIKGDLSGLDSHASRVGSSIGNALTMGVLAGGAAIAAGLAGGTRAFGDYEQGVADLNKIMGGTEEVQKKVANSMRELSMQSGTAVTSLLGVASSLSALGIGSEDLTTATKVVDQMGIALGLSNVEAASYLAGMNTLYGTSVDKWSNIASGINEVENSTSATARGMLNFSNEFAPIAKLFNVTDKEALAFGATMEALKLAPAEAANSLKSAVTVALADDKKMTAWAKLLKTDVANVKKALNEDLIGTLLKSASALDGMTSSSKAATVDAIWGAYGLKSMALIGDATKSYTSNLEVLNQGFEANVSIGKEVETRNNTLYGSWNKVKTGITDIGISIGEVTSGPLKRLMDGFIAIRPAIGDFIKDLLNGDWGAIEERFDGLRETIDKTFKGIGEGAGLALVGAGFISLASTVTKALASITAANVATWAKTKALAVTNAVTMAATVITNYARMAAVSVGSLVTMTARSAGQWAAQHALALRGAAVMAGGVIGSFGLMLSGALASLGGMLTRNAFVWGQMVTQSLIATGSMVTGVLSKYALMVAGVAASMAAIVATTIGGFASIVSSVAAPVALVVAGLAAIGYSLDPGKFTIFGQAATDAFNGIKYVVQDVWTAIQIGDWNAIATILKNGFGDAINFIRDLDWKGLGSELMTMTGDGAKNIIKTVFDLGGWIYKTGTDWVASGGPKRLGESIATTIGDAVKSTVGGKFDFWAAVKTAFKVAKDWISLGWDIISGIGSGIMGKIKEYLTPAQNQFVDFVKNVGDMFFGLGKTIGTAIDIGLAAVKASLESLLTQLGRTVPYFAQMMGSAGDTKLVTQSATPSITNTKTAGWGGSIGEYLSKQPNAKVKLSDNDLNTVGSKDQSGAAMTKKYGSSSSSKSSSSSSSKPAPSVVDKLVTGLSNDISTLSSDVRGVADSVSPEKIKSTYTSTIDPNYTFKFAQADNNLAGTIDSARAEWNKQTESWKRKIEAEKNATASNIDALRTSTLSNADILTNGIFLSASSMEKHSGNFGKTVDTSGFNFKSFIDASKDNFLNGITLGTNTLTAATQSNAATQIQATGYAATALRLGAEIGGKFTTDAGQAVSISMERGGMALIGSIGQGGANFVNAANQGAAVGLNSANQQGAIGLNAATNSASQLNSSAGKISSSSDQLAGAGAKAATDLATGVGSIVGALGKFAGTLAGMGGSIFGGGSTRSSSINLNGADVNGNFKDMTCLGDTVLVNGLKYTNPQGYTTYINPMTYQESGGIANYQGSGSSGGSSGGSGGYTLPPIFAARGADIKTPTLAWLGEKGEELVLPSDITQEIKGMIGDRKGRSQPAIISFYMNMQKVGQALISDIRQSGSVSVR